ncbi:MAG: hypothetical protein SGBAC_013023 [Bacillariaceae sp.]
MTVSRFPKAALFLKQQKGMGVSSEKEEGSSFITTRSLSESLKKHQKQKENECLRNLKDSCRLSNKPISDSMLFRFACYYNFNYELARTAIVEKFDDPHLHLRMDCELMQQFENLVIYPLPGLMTKNKKHEVLYFNACRHFPAEMDTELLINNICYVFNHMSMTEKQCRNGVALLVDLNQWTFKNFTNECSSKFLKALQNQVPTKIASVVIVNAPRWFPNVWRMMKTALSPSFAKKVTILKNPTQLQGHLMGGYEKYLPVEMGYSRDSTEMVEDFVDMKVHVESKSMI